MLTYYLMTKNEDYEALAAASKRVSIYQSILSLLHWDQETYMPPGGIAPRSEQVAQMSELIHNEKTSKRFRTLLEKLIHIRTGRIKGKHLTVLQKAAVREWQRDFLRQDKLPTSFVKEFSQVTAEAGPVWAIARRDNNFQLFAPFLEKIVRMNREKANFFGFEEHPYDALLESYEPCMNSNRVGKIFESLKKELVSLIQKIGAVKEAPFFSKEVAKETQMELGHWLSSKLPMEPAFTRLDLSSHPFSTGLHPKDSRITTRIHPNHFMSNLFSVLHEAGHSMYEMGLPTEHWGTPLAEASSLTVHESQSRWWETLIGRSLPFWKYCYPELQKKMPKVLGKISLDQFYLGIHRVAPSFIRVEADEVTYCLHIILRFEIERDLIEGKLQVADLPEAWNHRFHQMFGITPPSNTLGCLQDIHWSLGDFGYFPTYALGNLLAAQLFGQFVKDHPDWKTAVSQGKFKFIRDWLKEHVYKWGKVYNSDEFAKRVTGAPLSEKAYCRYLKDKYDVLYS